jgi:hypothetical protein
MLLHDLKDKLEDLAEANLRKYSIGLVNAYKKWRSEYNAFSTIKDVFGRAGETGVTSAGQLNPSTLLDVVNVRTNSRPSRNPLYENLAEFGKIMGAKSFPSKRAPIALYETFSESSPAKILGTLLQPTAPRFGTEWTRTAQTISPAQRFTQQPPEKGGE